MEYTKDVVLDINYSDTLRRVKRNNRISSFYRILKNNRFIITVFTVLILFITLDILLVANFMKLFTTLV